MHGVDLHPFGLQQQPKRVDEIRLIVGDQDPCGESAGGSHDLTGDPNSCAIRKLPGTLRIFQVAGRGCSGADSSIPKAGGLRLLP